MWSEEATTGNLRAYSGEPEILNTDWTVPLKLLAWA